MNYPSIEFDNAVAAVCHGKLGSDEAVELRELLLADQVAQDEYLWRVELHGSLASSHLQFTGAGPSSNSEACFVASAHEKSKRSNSALRSSYVPWNAQLPFMLVAALVVVLIVGGAWMWRHSQSQLATTKSLNGKVVAKIIGVDGVRLIDPARKLAVGDAVSIGQRIELSSGTAEVLFDSGAKLSVIGPAIVEPRTGSRVFLAFGEVHLVAETPESKGFVVVTPTSEFVDISTAFTARVSPDGLSRLNVSEGEVDVVLDRQQDKPRLSAGETLYVEPGERKIMTRIEEGDGTSAFGFPTIPPPTDSDYADQAGGKAIVRVAQGRLKSNAGKSGPAAVLNDGRGQSHQDSPGESSFFEDGTSGSFLFDLGHLVSIWKVNSYSWHQHSTNQSHRHRAWQQFTLYGFAGDQPPDLSVPPMQGGWTRIARVNSDRFFDVAAPHERPAQQACSITATDGEVGKYRFLLWEVSGNALLGEIDVFGSLVSELPQHSAKDVP